MPQLDVSTFSSQIFWLFISFSLLYIGLRWFVLPPIQKFFALRSGVMIQQQKDTQALLEKTQALFAEYEYKLTQAKRIAHDMIVQTRAELEKDFLQKEHALIAAFALKLKEIEVDIADKRQQIAGDIDQLAAELVGDIMAKLEGSFEGSSVQH